jgi:hypothetical protein
MLATPSRKRMNLDAQCLRCGAMNIPDNHICGRCGANLPVVYDTEGNVFDREAETRQEEMVKVRRKDSFGSPEKFRVLVRMTVIILSVLFLLWLIRHR